MAKGKAQSSITESQSSVMELADRLDKEQAEEKWNESTQKRAQPTEVIDL